MMISNEVFSAYSGCVEEVYGLTDYVYAPPITTVGSVLNDFVCDSEYYSVPSNFELNPVISVEERGSTFYYYPYMYYGPVYYVYDVPVVFRYQVLEEPCAPEASWSDELSYSDGYYHQAGDVCPYAAQETTSEAVTSFEMYYEEEGEHLNDAPFHSDDDDNKKDGDKKNEDDTKNDDDNGASPLGQKKSMNPDCVNESSAYNKFCSEMEERRKIVGASSQVRKTFINRGVVADPSEYRKFCDSVEDRLKKLSESSPGKKSTPDRDAVQSSYRKFLSTVEERREILNSSSVRQKTYVNRGIVADPSEYRKFCQSVDYKIKKLGSLKHSKSFEVKDFIVKQGSKVAPDERVVHKERSHSFRDMILKSAEYLYVQDNLKNSKYYRDLLYKEALRKQNKSTLMEILPSIIEEPFNFEDVTAECGELHVAEPREFDSNDEPKPVIIKAKQPKNRFKSFRKWWTKTFCCCCTTNQPP